ncbi:MAG: hypothetical protein QXZ24_08940, partial [Candidatus Jordarchaeales archaeon]
MKEATLDELAEAAGIPRRNAIRILRSFIRRGVAREVGGKVLFNPQRPKGFKAPFGGEVIELSVSVDRDFMNVGEVKVHRGGELVASMPCVFSEEGFVVDLSDFLAFYSDAAKRSGSPFSVKKAYNVFRRLMEGRGNVKNAGQWEIDAALGAILICGAISEELGLDYVMTTIDSASIPRRVEGKELEEIKSTTGIDIVAGYSFPTKHGRGLLLFDKAGKIYFSIKGELLADLEVKEEENIIEIDFTKLIEAYAKVAEKKKMCFSVEKVVDNFFAMLENEGKIEDYLKLVNRDEGLLLEAMYRISVIFMRLKGKDVTAKVAYPSSS